MGLALMEDEWNERRRIQMTSIVGGIKGKHGSVCALSVRTHAVKLPVCMMSFGGG